MVARQYLFGERSTSPVSRSPKSTSGSGPFPEDGRNHSVNAMGTSRMETAPRPTADNGDRGHHEDIMSYMLAKMNFLEQSIRQISDAVQLYDPSTLRMELRSDVSEVVESQSTHIQQVVEACVGRAVVKLEAALGNQTSSDAQITQVASETRGVRGVRGWRSERSVGRSGPDQESKTRAAIEPRPLSGNLLQEGESEKQQSAASKQKTMEEFRLELARANFQGDADSAKALAAGAGWLRGVDARKVTQPGRLVHDMPHTLTEHFPEAGNVHESKLLRMVHSAYFDFMSSGLILSNAVFVGIMADVNIRRAVNGEPSMLPNGYQIIQLVFCGLFLTEWAIRLLAHGRTFVSCRDKYWHMFDTVVVTFSTVDMIIGLAATQNSPRTNASAGSLLRIFRIFRMVRAIRMIRVLRAFKELRYVISSLKKSAALLLWPLVFLSILVYMCTIVISASLPQDIRASTAGERNPLVTNFGSISRAMQTLFMSAAGGMDWSSAVGSLSSSNDMSYMVFLVYIILSKFLLFNLMGGLFVLSIFENCKADDQRMLHENILNPNSHGARLKSIFEEVDVSGAGAMNKATLENLLTDKMVTDLLDEMDIDASEVAGTFKLLDVDDSGYVNIDEFMLTLFRLQASSQGVDLPSLLHESRKVGSHLVKATEISDFHISELKEALSQVQTLQSQSYAVLLNLQTSEPSGRA